MFIILEGLMLDVVCNQSLGVVNNVLNLHSLLLYMWIENYYILIDRYNHVVTFFF